MRQYSAFYTNIDICRHRSAKFYSEDRATPTINHTKDSVLGYKTPKLLWWVDLGWPYVRTKVMISVLQQDKERKTQQKAQGLR